MPLGVIPKNENNREEIVEILEIMHKYVPKDDDKLIEVSLFLLASILPCAYPVSMIVYARYSYSYYRTIVDSNVIRLL